MAKKSKNSNKGGLIRLSAMALAGAMAAPAQAPAQSFSCPISLLFGDYVTCTSTETATVTPTNSRTTTGCLSTGSAPYNRAQCNYTAATTPSVFQMSITAPSYNISTTGGAKMTVNSFSCRWQTSSTFTGACTQTVTPFFAIIDIGATLSVKAAQTGGTYTGTFTVTTNIP